MALRTTLRPLVCGTLPRSTITYRCFASTSRSLAPTPSPVASSSKLPKDGQRAFHQSQVEGEQSSTALKPDVRQKEAARDVVGGETKGAEGPHYKDQVMPIANASPLTAEGTWTMMNPIYTDQELEVVKIVNRPPSTISDRVVLRLVKLLRKGFDIATGYKSIPIDDATLALKPIPIEELRAKGQLLSDKNWLLRIILLESIAGVPGMVGGTLRHLRSLRLLRRDGGWIHTLLEEAENERMHLLTFMTISQPSWFVRALVLGAQGVFYNAFFFTYLISPRTAHRFVGCLEEEAVRTYTHCISDIEKGLVPEWKDVPAPRIAIDYWRLPETAKLLDVIKAVRADEATHRFVNHSLSDLDQKRDFNPFALGEADPVTRGTTYGFTREESAEFVKQQQKKLQERIPERVTEQ